MGPMRCRCDPCPVHQPQVRPPVPDPGHHFGQAVFSQGSRAADFFDDGGRAIDVFPPKMEALLRSQGIGQAVFVERGKGLRIIAAIVLFLNARNQRCNEAFDLLTIRPRQDRQRRR